MALRLTSISLVLLVLAPAAVEGAGTTSGLAVAVTADGGRVVAGGSNRTLYELDPTTLAVKRRVYFGYQVQQMVFSPSGGSLVIESTGAVHWLDAKTLAVKHVVEDAGYMSIAKGAGLIALNVKVRPYSIKVYDMESGQEKGAVPYGRKRSVAGFGVSNDGKHVAILFTRDKSESEKKVGYKEIPKDLDRTARTAFQLKNDGYTSQFLVVDVASGKPTLDTPLWYSPSGGGLRVYWHGAHMFIVGYKNQNAVVDAKGAATYFELGNSYNYAHRANADGSVILSGGLRSGTRTATEGLKAAPFRLDKMEGFPEYFKSFDTTADGSAFAGTTGWRAVRIGADGKVQAAQPVY